MKKTISVVALASLVMAGTAYGSGYRIPEQSADSTAKAGANIASALGPDASYFNPANMSWMTNEGFIVEGDFSWIHLTEIEYDDNRSATLDDETKDENFFVPTGFLVSPDYNGIRFGLAMVAPFGLSKRYGSGGYGANFAKEFSLQVIEVNPTVSFKVDNNISFAFGVRVLYSEATVKSNGDDVFGGPSASRDIEGDALDYGWNAALSIKPTEKSNISVTYRSHVDLDFDGDVTLARSAFGAFPGGGPVSIDTKGDVTVPAPAVASISGSYHFDKLTVEITIDRTFWSAYKNLDFDYDATLPDLPLAVTGGVPGVPGILTQAFDDPIPKNWDDANAYRLGLEYRFSSELTLMGGVAYDENPVPDNTLSFELPDSDAWIFSVGARYALSEQSEVAFGVLYDYKESRKVTNASGSVDGEFTNASAFFATVGYTYEF